MQAPNATTQSPPSAKNACPAGWRRAQVAALVFMLALIGVPPVAQLVAGLRGGQPLQELDILRRRPTLAAIQAYERALEDNSVVARSLRPYVHWPQLVALRSGNSRAIAAAGGTLWYRPSLDAAIAPGFMDDAVAPGDPLTAILSFRDALNRRGVSLVLCIAPGKEVVYPEWLSDRYRPDAGPAQNEAMPAFLRELREQGIPALDPADHLWGVKGRGELYLRQDTHWTPLGLEIVADELARLIPETTGATRRLRAEPRTVARRGDLYDMLGLPSSLPTGYAPETVTIQRVLDADTGAPYEPGPAAEIVLLGDSFTNIYSDPAMGWGDHAGLGEQLALRLGKDVRIIALNDGGVNAARAQLGRQPGKLDGVKVVVWQFAGRDLVVSNGAWQIISVP